MKRIVSLVVAFLISLNMESVAQWVDIYYPPTIEPAKAVDTSRARTEEKKSPIQFFDNGALDIFSNGKMQGTAQVIRINIGERKGFFIPIGLFVSSSGDGLGDDTRNENTVANLLNPIGGTFNLAWNGNSPVSTSESGDTRLNAAYQVSVKAIGAKDSSTGESRFLSSLYANIGIFFQTGAWNVPP